MSHRFFLATLGGLCEFHPEMKRLLAIENGLSFHMVDISCHAKWASFFFFTFPATQVDFHSIEPVG